MKTLDRHSFTPLYCQIAEALRSLIEDEGLSPGDRIPSENELTEQYNVSRNTVRPAINSLIRQGLVYRIQGKGTFVAPERMRHGLMELTSFTEHMKQRGLKPGSKVLYLARGQPPSKIGERLQLQSNEEVHKLERLRLANDEPLALNVSYIPCSICPNLDEEDLASGSLYNFLEGKCGLKIGYAEHVIKSAIATKIEAKLLSICHGCPVMVIDGVTYLENGIPIEYDKLTYRGDRYEFFFQSVRRHVYG